MSAPATHSTNPLEALLAEALHARADLVDAPDLAPATVPAVVVPLHRRGPVVAAVVTAGLVAAAAVLAVAVSGEDPTDRSEAPIATEPTSATLTDPAPSAPTPITGADDRFVETDLDLVDPGVPVTDETGQRVEVSADSATLTLTSAGGDTVEAALPATGDGSPQLLSSVRLDLGQAGEGWLVVSGAARDNYTVYNVRSGLLVPATVPGDVPFGNGVDGDGRDAYTWNNLGTLRTRIAVGTPAAPTYDVYRWELTGPGEGGGPDSEVVELVATYDGTFCVDPATSGAERCSRDPEGLLPEDGTDSVEPGEPMTYDDGAVGDLVPSGGGFDLEITLDGVPLRIPLPRTYGPRLRTQDLDLGNTHGWVVEEESGDSTAFRVVVFDGGDLVVAEVSGDQPLGNGYLEDGSRYETVLAGGGKALYTRVYDDATASDPERDPHVTYVWDVSGATLTPTLVG